MVIGYGIFGQDNGAHLFPDGHGKSICEVLDFVENRQTYLTDQFSVKRTNLSFSSTYDSAIIVNQKFKDFCLRNNYRGLSFYPVPKHPELYLFKAGKVIEFDVDQRNTRFEGYSEKCKRFNSVAGATPICLKKLDSVEDGFFRTDFEFGTGYEQSPLIVIGKSTYAKMLKEKFNDIDYLEILDRYDWENNS